MMTFEEAVDALFRGQTVRREGWEDPERVAYLTAGKVEGEWKVYSADIKQEDSLHDDWQIVGRIQ